MKFLRLSDPLLSVLFEDEDIIAIDKPYGFNAHTNDSKIEHSEYIQDGLIEMYEKQLEKKLHIIHRLDQTTTGVMIFGKSVESAKKYAEYFFNRQVQKTYWFITKFKSTQSSFFIDQQIIHKGRELDANTDLKFLKRSTNYELWQANPHTGRNHQIRIHAKAAKISILGDPKYEGHEYPFLCLHNHRIEFPNGVVIYSQAPVYFEDLSLLDDEVLAKVFFETDRRQRLFAKSSVGESFRLVHAQNNVDHPEFTIDQFGEVLVLNWPKSKWLDDDVKRFSKYATSMNRPIFVKFAKAELVQQHGQDVIIYPKDFTRIQKNEWISVENKIQYHIKGHSGNTVGLFSNQRLHRNWVLTQSHEKNVLNLFSYTSTYSLAAGQGGAKSITSVDLNKNYLNWSRDNFSLNHLHSDAYKFLLRDSLTYLEQCIAKNVNFDLIICDTPSFYRREKSLFKIDKDLEKILENCLRCLSPNGDLLFSTNFDGFFIDDIRQAIVQVQKKLQIPQLEISCILAALDFELPNEKTNLKSFLIHLG